MILEKSRIHTLDINPDSNISHILLKESTFARLIVPWDFLEHKIDYDKSSYLALIKNYRDLGWFDDEDKCYFRHREEGRSIKPFGWSPFLDHISLHSCGYGIQPKQTILTSLELILTFALLFWTKFTFWKDLGGGDLITKPVLSTSNITVLLNNDSSQVTYNPHFALTV